MGFEHSVGLEMPADGRSPQRARRLLESDFPDLGRALSGAQVVVSELVTNAFLYGLPPVRLEILTIASGVRIQVHDSREDVGPARVESHGFQIIATLAEKWGISQTIGGKCVWAEVANLT